MYCRRPAGEEEGSYALPVCRGHCGCGARNCGRTALSRLRQAAEATRHRLRQPDQDDDRSGDLLHHRAGDRIGPQGVTGREGGRHRPGLLPDHVDAGLGIGLVVGNIIHPGEGCTLRRMSRRRPPAPATAEDDDRRLPAHDSHHPVLGADHRGRAADPAGRPAGGLRPAGNGQER